MRIEDGATKRSDPPVRGCDHPGCAGTGDFRAPRSRVSLDLFHWFCLEHVRSYNSAWNFYAGMSAQEIEREIRNDTVWQRPTWPMGTRAGMRYAPRFRDYGMFGLDDDDGPTERRAEHRRRTASPQDQALAIFNLMPPLTLVGLKARYKELVKLNHPDVHGGDKAAEERLKIVNLAYATLKASYFP
ncbi:MAG TPA: J domain-containing protein [Stellaceae bacterium]|nr:J domain-containing protein [Stellaceae bacterium]